MNGWMACGQSIHKCYFDGEVGLVLSVNDDDD